MNWQLIDVLNEAVRFLESHGIVKSRVNAERILCHVLELDRIQLYLNFERILSRDERTQYKQLLHRIVRQEPLQYITGQTEFMSLVFNVQPGIFIPRPETEILVEKTIEQVQKLYVKDETVNCLDIGTGSGNIAVSLARNLENIQLTALDIDKQALAAAKKNAEINQVRDRIDFVHMDIMNECSIERIGRRFDVVISNPPYVSEEDYRKLPENVREHEPRKALDGGQDGLRFYRRLNDLTPALMMKEGLALFEIGADQAEKIRFIFSESFGTNMEVFKDLAQQDRIILLRKGMTR